jgi:hypothetical protein
MKQVYTNVARLPKQKWQHNFDLVKNDNEIILNRSNNSDWVDDVRGKESARVTDTGNGLVVIFDQEKKVKLDYDQAEELFILLSQCEWDGIEIKESKTTMKWPL